MLSTDLTTRSCTGRAVVALRGELDMADAAAVEAALTALAAREPRIIVDLVGLEFVGGGTSAGVGTDVAVQGQSPCHGPIQRDPA